MKAAVYYRNGPPDVLQYEDVPDPVCGPGLVVIQIEAISIEGGDTLNRLGGALTAEPHIVGYQSAGTIIEVGEGVTDRVLGDRVVATFMNGSHAERIAVPAQVTWKLPDGADLVACACVPVAFGTAHDCLFEFGHLQAGETVLIQAGAGGVGMAAIQLAHRAGATTIATASSLDRLKPLLELGLDHAVDYSKDGWVDDVRALTDGRGVDLVVDSVGGQTLQKSIACLAYRGRAVTVGNAGRDFTPVDVGALDDEQPVAHRRVSRRRDGDAARAADGAGTGRRGRRRKAHGAGRPHVRARRGGGRPRLHREPASGRAGRAHPVSRRAGFLRTRRGQDVEVTRLVRAGALGLLLTASSCVAHPVGPARTFGKYEGKAVTTAEGVLSAVETARLVARTASAGNAFGPYVGAVSSEAEESASRLQGTFDSIQPPNAHADSLRDALDDVIGDAVAHLAALRIAVRRGELASAARTGAPLESDARRLNHFIERHQ